MKPISFDVEINQNTSWRVGVVVWPNHKSMYAEFMRTPPNNGYDNDDFSAFCHQLDMAELAKADDRILATIHFCITDGITPELIAHEAYHAFLNYARLIQLKLHGSDEEGEELAAGSMGIIVGEITSGLKKRGVKIR